MIGKRAIILTLLIILVSQVVLPAQPAMAQAPPLSSCTSKLGPAILDLFNLNFLEGLLTSGGPLLLFNLLTSAAADPPSAAGFDVGGVLEPFDELSDFLFNKWMSAVFIGVAGTFGALIAGYLVDFGLSLNLSLNTSNAIIDEGYGIILALVNLGFVIAIIIIAFATIFRRSGWDAQSTLARLIIAALLVNFSLFFGLMILNVGTNLMGTILGGACPGTDFASTFHISRMYNNIESFLSSAQSASPSVPSISPSLNLVIDFLAKIFNNFLIAVLSLFLSALLTIIGMMTLLGIFLFLIARYVAVTILLIFMPIAWLGLIFPKLDIPGVGNAWGGWWKQFLRWVFYGPIIAFFLYMTVRLISYLGSQQAADNVAGIGLAGGFAQMLVVVVFSLGGLYAANKIGIAGASAVYGSVAKMGAKQLASIKASGVGIAASALRTKPAGKVAGWMAGGKLTIPGTKFKVPTGMKEIGRAALEAEAYTRKQAEAGAKRYEALTPKQKNQLLVGMRPNSAEYAKVLESLLKEGSLDPELANGQLRERVKRGLEWSKHGDLYKRLEQFTVNTSKSLEELTKGNLDDAAREIRRVFDEAKDNDFGKNIKLGRFFDEIKMGRFKKKDGATDVDAYNKAIIEAKNEQEKIIKGLLLTSPEKIQAAFKSLAPGAQKIAFSAMMDNVQHNKDGRSVMGIASEISGRVNQYFTSTAAQKLFKNVYSGPEKETIEREEFEARVKKEG